MAHRGRIGRFGRLSPSAGAVLAAVGLGFLGASPAAQGPAGRDGSHFTSGVELVNVTATVTRDDGRFVEDLRREDFTVFENDKRQEVAYFDSGKVPLSLGIALDTSASMTPPKMVAARAAIDRLVVDLLDKDDEVFFMRFSSEPRLAQEWTTDRAAIARAVAMAEPSGGTAIYDAVAHALPIAASGRHRKKAVLVISDGNDTNSHIGVHELRQAIHQSDVLVYALGVDGPAPDAGLGPSRPRAEPPIPMPFPWPGGVGGPSGGRGRPRFPPIVTGGGPIAGILGTAPGARLNADALRQITDDTGGRTEIVRRPADLERATSRLANELSRQYELGYSSTEPKDGKWHDIRVEVRGRKLRVRARRGYVAG